MKALLSIFLASTEAAGEAAEKGWLSTQLDRFFDPAWNLQHQFQIWGVIVFVLVTTGVGLPTPEDIWLMLAGFSAYKQAGDQFVWWAYVLAFFVCTVSNLIGDSLAWGMGKRWGFGIRNRFKFMKRMLTDKRIRKVQGWFDNYGNWTVFMGRQVAGVRFVTFFTAGTMRMPLRKFVFYDFLGCFISIPVWLTLGGLAAVHGREWMEKASGVVSGTFLAVVLVVIAILLLILKVRSARRAKLDEAIVAGDVPLAQAPKPEPEHHAEERLRASLESPSVADFAAPGERYKKPD